MLGLIHDDRSSLDNSMDNSMGKVSDQGPNPWKNGQNKSFVETSHIKLQLNTKLGGADFCCAMYKKS